MVPFTGRWYEHYVFILRYSPQQARKASICKEMPISIFWSPFYHVFLLKWSRGDHFQNINLVWNSYWLLFDWGICFANKHCEELSVFRQSRPEVAILWLWLVWSEPENIVCRQSVSSGGLVIGGGGGEMAGQTAGWRHLSPDHSQTVRTRFRDYNNSNIQG